MPELDTAKYFSLATFRKDGRKVATPVWFAQTPTGYYVFSAGDAGKVKRLRNSSKAEVAVCDMQGKVLGDWQPAVAELVDDPASVTEGHTALRKKYGWQMWLADIGSKLTGRFDKRQFIRVNLTH